MTESKLNLSGVTVPNAVHANSADSAVSALNANHSSSSDTATTAGGAPPTGQAGGDLTGSYPAPTIAAAPTLLDIAANPIASTDPCSQPAPQTHVFCGRTGAGAGYWSAGDYATNPPGVQIWRDRVGEIHIRGEAQFSGNYASSPELFYLPPSERPSHLQSFPVATGKSSGAFQAGSGLLAVFPTETGTAAPSSGAVELIDPGFSGGTNVFIGEIVFRTDA